MRKLGKGHVGLCSVGKGLQTMEADRVWGCLRDARETLQLRLRKTRNLV